MLWWWERNKANRVQWVQINWWDTCKDSPHNMMLPTTEMLKIKNCRIHVALYMRGPKKVVIIISTIHVRMHVSPWNQIFSQGYNQCAMRFMLKISRKYQQCCLDNENSFSNWWLCCEAASISIFGIPKIWPARSRDRMWRFPPVSWRVASK